MCGLPIDRAHLSACRNHPPSSGETQHPSDLPCRPSTPPYSSMPAGSPTRILQTTSQSPGCFPRMTHGKRQRRLEPPSQPATACVRALRKPKLALEPRVNSKLPGTDNIGSLRRACDHGSSKVGGLEGRKREKRKRGGLDVPFQAAPVELFRKSFPLIIARGRGFSEGGGIRGTSEGRGL